jgi:two-component system, NtrC family, nitrogen regulation sensor histidine kinase NtrY
MQLGAYLLALHAVALGLAWLLFHSEPWHFVLAEVAAGVSLLLGGWLLHRALEPVRATRRFRDLLQDQQFAARLQGGGGAEAEELIGLFNRLLGQLHDERLKIGEQQGFLDRLLQATPSAVVVFDFDGAVSLRNASASRLLGERGEGPLWRELDALANEETRLLVDSQGRRLRALRGRFFDRGFGRDFLLVEELTAELQRSERATYDKLVRVLAHEVNNTVAATGSVLGALGHYRDQLNAADRADFAVAVAAVQQRNASLGAFIERFTGVAKMPEPELHPAALHELLDAPARLFAPACAQAGVALEWSARDDGLHTGLDHALMEQALVNVLKNALEATPAGGRIRLALCREGERARISICDSGNRLGEVSAAQLFTPFFTTKRGGQGLGLMFVREVLQRHGFEHRLAATGSGETRFDIWLPLLQP